jgi:SAM-dependent methyltransferase
MMSIDQSSTGRDPNSIAELKRRQDTLDRAHSPSRTSKDDYILEQCFGRDVIDLGCVGQAVRAGDPEWLHGRIHEVARRTVGVDIDSVGVERLRSEGYDALYADVSDPPPLDLVARPFDVAIASEIVEHMSCPQHLFSFAHAVLKPGGLLLVTTPNPFAPARIALARRGINRDNVDHAIYAFPAGIAEMSDRTGLMLCQMFTTTLPNYWTLIKRCARSLESDVRGRERPIWYLPPAQLLALLHERKLGWAGETAVYVIRKPDET